MPADAPRLVDLSHPIRDGMPVYPGDPEVSIGPALTVDADGVDVARIRMGSHTGTHIDAPSHTVRGGRTMADVGRCVTACTTARPLSRLLLSL